MTSQTSGSRYVWGHGQSVRRPPSRRNGQTPKRERETVSTEGRTEASDFKDGDRVWVEDEDDAGTITFAGGNAALVLMDSGYTWRVSYAKLSRLIPQTHTDVPDDSASAPEAHIEPASTIPQTSGSEHAELLKRSQTSWPAKTSGVDLDPACPHGYLHRSNCERCPETPEPKPIVDMVNSPPHYQANPAGIEVIQITEHLNFCLGNAVKYILRCDHKGDAEKDLRKAIWYLERELQRRAAPVSVEVSPDEEEQAK